MFDDDLSWYTIVEFYQIEIGMNSRLEKLDCRLFSWKRNYTCQRGAENVIEDYTLDLPTFYLSLFTIPISVANRIERRLQWNLLWGDMGDQWLGD